MNEINGKKARLLKDGNLNLDYVGWSKDVFYDCDIDIAYLRKKIWNRYMWMSENYICRLSIVKLDYMGVIFLDFYNLKENKTIHKKIKVSLCNGMIIHNAIGSYAHFQNKDIYINIIRVQERLHIIIKWNEIDVEAMIYLQEQSLNVLIPHYDNKFHYTSKQFPLTSNGNILIDDERYDLKNSMSFIDYGRGIWEREKSWMFLTCGFKTEESKIGLNLGSMYSDINENAIKINYKLHKINNKIEFKKIDNQNYSIKSIGCDDIDLKFSKDSMNEKISDNLIIKWKFKQYVGKLNGVIKIDKKEILFEDVLCWLEDNYAKW